ncbi:MULTISPECIES: quinoprotein relay system zinc metallohydrolase 2 [Methylosinus]|uniref:MBL fold metallo-hydrolase n=1 Tax=Methylosinus trichosporium (strain ATCC 35070 / NCIMB 11131 / UNIQEM 75 / OB3b) TaxID=595536 RepID=A0A2D2D1Q7_METT3|nr:MULTISPECIES: quinoprotein relay system zinc metallohydrolase 2 [Methylosinus]ATQ68941.1 MBL fold metallo-hydrolase [Methylosinus trichosporium OB3b]OBS52268.1 MBL fold metallo-hydrolase [Methylosinus sp. 3S-1]
MLQCTRTALAIALFCLVARSAGAFDLNEVAPGVFVHQGQLALMTQENSGDIANLGAIVGEKAVAVIDTGGSAAEGRAFLAALQQRTTKPLRYVINTHVHPDHIFGNIAFRDTGALFVGHKNLPRALAARGPHYLSSFRAALGPLIDEVALIAPTLTVDGVTTLDLGGRSIELRAWRTAHSDADLTVLDAASGTLFAGDLLFLRHVPVVDGSLLGFLAVVDELRRIDARRVVPGHGPAVAPWPQALDAQAAYLQRLTRDLRAAIAAGESLGAAATSAAQSEKSAWSLFHDYNVRNATAGFAELEWDSP